MKIADYSVFLFAAVVLAGILLIIAAAHYADLWLS